MVASDRTFAVGDLHTKGRPLTWQPTAPGPGPPDRPGRGVVARISPGRLRRPASLRRASTFFDAEHVLLRSTHGRGACEIGPTMLIGLARLEGAVSEPLVPGLSRRRGEAMERSEVMTNTNMARRRGGEEQ